MKLLQGSTRLVIIFCGLAFKFPRLGFTFKMLARLNINCVEDAKRVFWAGIKANYEERLCWKKTKAPFLAPTYLSLFIFNIQKEIKGRDVSEHEIRPILRGLFDVIENGKRYWVIDPHIWDRNFKKTKNGYVLLDYSNLPFGYPLGKFIQEHKKELTDVLIKK